MHELPSKHAVDQLKKEHPGWSFYDNTQRVKSVLFTEPSTVQASVTEAVRIWDVGKDFYPTPLVQVRAILPLAQEQPLLLQMKDLENCLEVADSARVSVAGKMALKVNGSEYGIYYLQIESANRKSYRDNRHMNHEDAVKIGLEKKKNHTPRPIPEGFSIQAIQFINGVAVDILAGKEVESSLEGLAQGIIGVHKLAFDYPHDPPQRTDEGAKEILLNNPNLVAMDPQGQVASVGYMEKDDRFTFGGIALVEPTYFTHPGEEYRKKGLSSHIRQATKRLVEMGSRISVYKGAPMIVFNESIRHTSFPLCLENDCYLGGNLGDSYTAIGPANPDAGYMPMGLTYFIDPRIDIIKHDNN